MLIERSEFRDQTAVAKVIDADNIFRYCEFAGFSYDGGHVDGVFIGCTFAGLDWYWGLFNNCLFSQTRFTKCIFRGTSFPDCCFVDCDFIECQFLGDNLSGRGCAAEGARVYGGSAKACKGAEFLFANVDRPGR